MFEKGKKWTNLERIKIYFSKHEDFITEGLLKDKQIKFGEKAEKYFTDTVLSKLEEEKKFSSKFSDEVLIKRIIKSFMNQRVFKSEEEQVLENLRAYYKEKGEWDEFRRLWGWNEKITYEKINYDKDSKRYYIINKKGEIVFITKKYVKVSYNDNKSAAQIHSNSVVERYNDFYIDL